MQLLTRTVKRDLGKDKAWMLAMLSTLGKLSTSVELHEEPGEIVITLLMNQAEIEQAVKDAVKDVLGTGFEVSDVSVTCGGRLIKFSITNIA